MKNYRIAMAVLGFIVLFCSGQAFGDSTCTTFDSTNGTMTFPGTYVGTVSSTCQIGNLADQNQGNALVNSTANPSIYEFQLTSGGSVTLVEELGNNGIGNAVDVELDALAAASSTSPSGAALASIQIPYTSGPSIPYTVFSGNLSAGYYALDTYLATSTNVDPRYQANITETATTVPEIDAANSVGPLVIAVALGLMFADNRRKSPSA